MKERDEKIKSLKSIISEQRDIIKAVDDIVFGGHKPSDFMLSFPMVRAVWNLYVDWSEYQ